MHKGGFKSESYHFLKIAQELSVFSSCIKKKAATIIVKDRNIIASGYNGTPNGFVNCDVRFANNNDINIHDEWTKQYEIHSIFNALINALRERVDLSGSTLYCTHEPCVECIKVLLQSDIKRIAFLTLENYSDKERETILNLINIRPMGLYHFDENKNKLLNYEYLVKK